MSFLRVHRAVRGLQRNFHGDFKIGTRANVQGWIKYLRKIGKLNFVRLSDGMSPETLQIVLDKSRVKFSKLRPGQAVRVSGEVIESPKPDQPIEIVADEFTVLGDVDESFPIQHKTAYDPRFVRKHIHLRPKTNSFGAFLRVRSAVRRSIEEFFQREQFLRVDTPILTGNDCEGASENVFIVEEGKEGESRRFFYSPVFLSVSGQLHLECVAGGIPRVYSFNPTFRAEKQTSRNHLSEFYMIEGEMGFVERLEDVMQLVEGLIRHTANELEDIRADIEIVKKYHHEDEEIGKRELGDFAEAVQRTEMFPRVRYSEAISILKQYEDRFDVHAPEFSEGLSRQQELMLVEHFGGVPLFITHYPSDMKPFYMKRTASGDEAECFDLVCPLAGEICGGSLRENDYNLLAKRCPESLQWYADLRKFGYAPCGGFGIGFERLLQTILNIFNLKDCIPFPRWHKNCQM